MRITLINPGFGQIFKLSPLGLLYIAAVLREAGHNVSVIDTVFIKSMERFELALEMSRPDIVGITCMTPTINSALGIAKTVKTKYNCTVIFGGAHPTIMPESVLENTSVDYVVEGEGEHTVCELTECLQEGNDIKHVPGIWYKENNVIKRTASRKPIENLDSIPFPARDLAPADYFKYGRATIITSRGCPFNCTFCQPTLRRIFGPRMRLRNPENIVTEIEFIQYSLDIRFLKFEDDTFTVNRQWVLRLCDEIKHKNLNISWECNARVNTIDAEMLRNMKEAGCMKVSFGVESGSQKILDSLNKGITLDNIIEAFKLCKDIGLRTHAYFMIGSPEEDKLTIEATEKLIKQIKPDDIYVSITTPLPMTNLYEDLLEKDLITAEDWADYDYYQKCSIAVKDLSQDEIKQARRKITLNFWLKQLLKPAYWIRTFKNYPSPRLLFNMAIRLVSGR